MPMPNGGPVPLETRYLNLVFQGGGVRGIAYAGVLDKMPDECKINAVGGSSVGAIVAALLAVGTSVKELKKILEEPELYSFLEELEVQRWKRLKTAWDEGLGIWQTAQKAGKLPGPFKLWRFVRRHHTIRDDINAVWQARGLHSTKRIRAWLDKKFETKTFEDISVGDLRILAANVSKQKYDIYDKAGTPTTYIAEAVNASISIPLFFTPFGSNTSLQVDGGMLSNFPSFLFAQGKYPTIGFRLKEISAPNQIDSVVSYLKGLVFTMTEAHDKARGNPSNFKCYDIIPPPEIPSTKFALEKHDIEKLYWKGRELGDVVKWKDYSSPTPVISYYEPDPQTTLQYSLKQASRLYDNFANEELWVDDCTQTALLIVHIEKNWTTRYDRVMDIEVSGRRSLFLTRSVIVMAPFSKTNFQASLAEAIRNSIYEEVVPTGVKETVRIPAFNDELRKGFVVFYSPPISEGQGKRRFHTAYRIEQEFVNTVAKGINDAITFTIRQNANKHNLQFSCKILSDIDLPELVKKPDFPCKTAVRPGPEFDDKTNRNYRVWECTATGPTEVQADRRYAITVGRG